MTAHRQRQFEQRCTAASRIERWYRRRVAERASAVQREADRQQKMIRSAVQIQVDLLVVAMFIL
jgi:hypothetical protein